MTIAQSDAGFLRTLARGALVEVVSDKQRLAGFCERLDWGLRDPKAGRHSRAVAMKIYSDILQRCGVEGNQVTQQIFLSIGARDERDAARKIAIVNEAEAKSPEQRLDETAAWLDGLLFEHPELRERARERLACVLRAAPQLNGHANG